MINKIALRIPDPPLKRVRRSARAMKKKKDPYSVLVSLMPFEGSGVADLGSRSEFYLKKKF